MRLKGIIEELKEDMTKTLYSIFSNHQKECVGIAYAYTESCNIEAWMYQNRNEVRIIHNNAEDECECENVARYIEDNLPLWYEIYDD